jgi:hypothetical protein
MPAFLLAHLFVTITGGLADGFSKPYQDALDISAVLYLILGMVFLGKFLREYYQLRTVILALFALLFGSNLYYYSIFEGGYSHVYSFFLFAAFIYYFQKFQQQKSPKDWYLIIAIGAGIILVRQINILFVLLVIGLSENGLQLVLKRNWKQYVFGILIAIGVLLPQILYNIYLTGTLFFDSYTNEGFIYFANPKIKEVLLGFHNGWITVNPLFIFLIPGIFLLFKKQKNWAIISSVSIILCTYIYASWWAWDLGCGYGHRGFVDIYPLLILPICAVIDWIFSLKVKPIRGLLFSILALVIMANIKFIYTYDSCWPINFQQSDFEIYWHFLTSPTK